MSDFNDIGISRELDWPRIKKLLTIGLFASVLHLAGDLILSARAWRTMRLKAFYRCYWPILLPRTAAFLPRRCWGFSAWCLRDFPASVFTA